MIGTTTATAAVLATLLVAGCASPRSVTSPASASRPAESTLPAASGSFAAAPSASDAPAAVATAPGSTAPGSDAPWVIGYYAGYEEDLLPVAEIDWADLTDVAVAFFLPRPDGSLDTTLFSDAAHGPALAADLVPAAHAHGRRVLASVGGAGVIDDWRAAAAPDHREAFVRSLVALVEDGGYDGLDLDWEPVEAADGATVIDLAARLRQALPRTLLTMPVGIVAEGDGSDLSIYRRLAPLLDRISIMSYGMAGPWEGWRSWHSSPLRGETAATPTSVESSVRAYLTAGVPPAKLGVGAGFYGLCYGPPVTGPGQVLGAHSMVDDGSLSFIDIQATYASAGTLEWDARAEVPYLTFDRPTGPKKCTYISYEDARSLRAKGAWTREQGLGGAIIWTIGMGHLREAAVDARDPLLAALREGLGR